MREISLHGKKGGVALVSDEDYDRLSTHRWHQGAKGYVESSFRVNGKTKTIRMHQLVLTVGAGQEVDHWNRNKLDNQRGNLRAVPRAVNQWNTAPAKANNSGHTGACPTRTAGRWAARIRIARKTVHLGTFGSPEEANAAYETARRLRDETGALDGWIRPTRPALRHGEQHKSSKLTADKARDIRHKHEAGMSCGELAREYGVTAQSVWAIIRRETWAWVE